jgi:transposase
VVQTRQVFNLPILKFEVTEHCAMQAVCRCGKVHKGVFPAGVNAGVQYGPRAQAAVKSCVLHADETGIRMAKSLHWLHGLATESLTWIGAHPRRGTEAFKSRAQRQQFKGVQANVPFTNNLAKQAVHRPKVKEKVPDCLRTRQSVKAYYVIRTWCATLQKQGVNISDTLVAAFKGATPR